MNHLLADIANIYIFSPCFYIYPHSLWISAGSKSMKRMTSEAGWWSSCVTVFPSMRNFVLEMSSLAMFLKVAGYFMSNQTTKDDSTSWDPASTGDSLSGEPQMPKSGPWGVQWPVHFTVGKQYPLASSSWECFSLLVNAMCHSLRLGFWNVRLLDLLSGSRPWAKHQLESIEDFSVIMGCGLGTNRIVSSPAHLPHKT